MQMVRVARRKRFEENEDRWKVAAFNGWIYNISQPRDKGKKAPSFRKWLRMFGFTTPGDGLYSEEVEAEKAKAVANARKVIAAFDRGVREVKQNSHSV